MNKIELIGRISNDLELRAVGENQVVDFNLAVDRFGSKEKKTDFIPCEVWGKSAENLVKFCKKGSQVAVVGSLNIDTWEKDGKKGKTVRVRVEQVVFLNAKGTTPTPSGATPLADTNESDIPF